jgi:hypothetical protein
MDDVHVVFGILIHCFMQHPSSTFTKSLISFDSSFLQMFLDHMLTKDDICTLANVVIANPTRVNILPQSCTSQRFVASNAAQAKEMNYLKIC